jgi:hypothetical protein
MQMHKRTVPHGGGNRNPRKPAKPRKPRASRHKGPVLDPYGHPILVGANPPDPGNTPYIDNTPYQTANGAYLWLEQHPVKWPAAPTAKTPPNVHTPSVPANHVHVHQPIHRVKIITQHPLATLPFTALVGTSSKVPRLHTYSAIAPQQARR